MIGKTAELAKSSVAAYKKGGGQLLLERSARYVQQRINQQLLFRPFFPPVKLDYNARSIPLGHNDKYLYYDATPMVIPHSNDTVVEAGVHHGNDSAMFAKLADQVVGFEPSPRNFKKAKNNLRRFDNITLHNKGLWDEKSELEIQHGESGGDDGFLTPDSGANEVGENIPVNTLEEFVDSLDIGEVNFLKIEAEGAEPEIINGLGKIRPEKIVVNADEERDGESPINEIMHPLQSMGYNLVAMSLGCVLFFVLDTEYHYAFRSEYL